MSFASYWYWMWDYEDEWLVRICELPGGALPGDIPRARYDAINAMLDLRDWEPHRDFWLAEAEAAEAKYREAGDAERMLNVRRWLETQREEVRA